LVKGRKAGEQRGSATRRWLSKRFIEIVAEMAGALSSRKADASDVGQVELIVADTARGLSLEAVMNLGQALSKVHNSL